MIQFSVIIPTFNRGALLREVVYALTHQESPGCDYEIVPVDNASTDNTRAVVEEMSTASPIPIRYQYEPKPGSHYARNTGFKSANGEILGLIDDDVVVDSSWVRQMTQPYEDPKVSCVGGRIILRWINGEPQEFLASYREILGEINYGPQFKELTFPVSVNAGNLSIRREMLMGVGGYNPCSAPGDLRLVGDGEVGLCNKVYASGGFLESCRNRVARSGRVEDWVPIPPQPDAYQRTERRSGRVSTATGGQTAGPYAFRQSRGEAGTLQH